MLFNRKARKLNAYLKESSGNVAIIAALAIIPILSVLGLAVDWQLVVTKKNGVQHTLDATLIAAARERQAGASEAAIDSFTNIQFDALMQANDPGLDCGGVLIGFNEETDAIEASVRCTQPTTLSAIFGRTEVSFEVTTGSTFGVGAVDVAFVFDLSGSMNENRRLPALQEAANDAIDILLAAGDASSGDQNSVRIAIAAYNHAVNAGPFFDEVVDSNRRPATLELSEAVGDLYPDNTGIVQIDARDNRRFWDFETVNCTSGDNANCNRYTDFGARFYPEEDTSCVYARQGVNAFTDEPPTRGSFMLADQPIWDYGDNRNDINRPDDFNMKRRGEAEILANGVGRYRDGGDGRTNPPLRQAGGRNNDAPSSYGASRGGGNATVTAENNALTFHARIRDEVPGRAPRDFISNNRRLDGCRETGAPLPLTDREASLKNYTRNMRADGATAGHLGIAWGWYLLSPKWDSVWPNDSKPLEYFEEDTAKAMIIMTDGVFNSTHPSTELNSNEQAAAYCRAIKSETNIRVYTVGFDVPTRTENVDGEEVQVPNLPLVEGTDQNILEFCASDEDAAFDAAGQQELLDAYSQIAVQISDLRLSR